MGDAPPIATTIEALGAHIWHLQQQFAEQHATLREMMATQHMDFKRVNETISQLVTKAELESRLAAVREEIANERPSAKIKSFAVWAAAITAIITFMGMSFAMLDAVHEYADRIKALPAPK